MIIDVLTLFPKMFGAVASESIIKRAVKAKKVRIRVHNIREYTKEKHRKVDDRPFGGGPGMVIQCQPVIDAIKKTKKLSPKAQVVLMTPKGRPLTQKLAEGFLKKEALILLSGHYEGIDERIRVYVDEQVSIGDYILTGGELPAMVLIDTIVRLIPGVLGDEGSNKDETFTDGMLEYPHYTRPADYQGKGVPEILLSGRHDAIKRWRRIESVLMTMKLRPDLIKNITQLEI